MVTSTTQHVSALAAHPRLGCSTGFLRDGGDDWTDMVTRARATSTEAIELAALSERELPGLLAFLGSSPALPFRFLSVHAPSKHRELPEAELVALLEPLVGRVEAIVVHPDTMQDLGAWIPLGRTLTVENMDLRKPTGRTADELAPILATLPQAQLCFDVAHAAQVDPTLAAGHEILDRFGSRLRHVHVSALDERGKHRPTTAADEAHLAPLLDRCRDVPWILEAPLRPV
ncbi:hypothetical protein GKE82_19750 [Conexibacter sp. W3-3-2]|uniref:Xylose isomerase-like TIM barrel domain-containing protein n=1 Tax=Paraconexibacter algicola TaxID=2133960 RepID=A0A2T4ULK8_9ACTN|nr:MULTISPECIES: hypothetical protein [Solirubrobacterales]MTD46460.1 hypothetical protein [Conexibacter sp. W3-3-2]PTL60111.1 hypothetical protein C7Y72_10870 [Paraconexibacter algicola]